MSRVTVEGYAIVSADDRIADAKGRMPQALKNEADWIYFQRELGRSALSVLGRLGHLAHPAPPGRRRMIVSRSVAGGLEERADGWWWNPETIPWPEAAACVLPDGGRVAVPGGQGVFDLFLGIGYDAFHLARAERVRVPGGVPLFGACRDGATAEDLLRRSGLRPGPREVLDEIDAVSLTVWRR